MDSLVRFFLSFEQYVKVGDIYWTILLPFLTLMVIGGLTFSGLKFLARDERLRTVFFIHKSLIICSLFVAMVLVALISYFWSKNLFAKLHWELALIISLILAFVVSITSFVVLRNYWTRTKVNEIIGQPISAEQERKHIPHINKAFNNNKIWYSLPFVGFLFLLFSLSSGMNLISIVYDNSVSMDGRNAVDALSKTFDRLEKNNEIIFTNLNCNKSELANCKSTLADILAIKQSNKIKAGLCSIYDVPELAKQNFQSTFTESVASPICEVIWKMWLFTKENRENNVYKNKLLIVITDGDDLLVKEDLQVNNKFLFDNTEFAEYYTPDNVHIIDYSNDSEGVVIKKFQENGAIVYPAVSSIDDYLSALDGALLSFQKDKYLIIWTILICVVAAIIGILITPKKI